MDRPRLLIPLALLLAVLIGGAGYYGVAAALGKRDGDPNHEGSVAAAQVAGQARMAKRIAALEKRIELLESRPSLTEKLNDQNVRRQLTEVMLEARRRDREADELKRKKERSERVVRWYRSSYDRLLAEAHKACVTDEKVWNALRPVFDKHFEPVAKAVREGGAAGEGRRAGWVRVNISQAVAPVLPETIAAVKQGLPEKAWTAFDAWRRKVSFNRYGQTPGAEYFLGGDELKQARSRAAVERRWAVIKGALPELHEELRLGAAKKEQLNRILRKHAENFTAAFDGRPFVNVNDGENREKVVRVAALTDAAVKKLLSDAGVAKYDKWKGDPESRVRLYFGQGGGRWHRGDRRDRQERDQREPRPVEPRKGEVF